MTDLRGLIHLKPEDRVLDFGDGIVDWAAGLATDCGYVTGLYFSEDHVAEVASAAIERGIPNISFQWTGEDRLAALRALPSDSFDWVTCLWVSHLIETAPELMRESIRVLKAPGRLLLTDWIGATDPDKRAVHDRIARSRRPDHQIALTRAQLEAGLAGVGLSVERATTWNVTSRFDEWMDVVDADSTVRARTRRLVLEAAKRRSTDWQITTKDKVIEFTHHNAAWVALNLG